MFKMICYGLVASILLFAVHVKAEELDAGQIIQEIKQKGPRSVVDKFWDTEDHQKSEQLINSISTGTDKWLEVAKLLKPGSDAAATEELFWAVSKALPKNPIGVLTLLKTQSKDFPIDLICRDPFFEDTVDLETEGKFLKEAEKALVYLYDQSHDKELDALRWQCLEGIRRDLRLVEKDKDKSGVQELPIKVIPPSSSSPSAPLR
jgi:hypothetical protein